MDSNGEWRWSLVVVTLCLFLFVVALAVLIHAIKTDQQFGVSGEILRIADFSLVIAVPFIVAFGIGWLFRKPAKATVLFIFQQAPKRPQFLPTSLGVISTLLFAAAGSVVTSPIAKWVLPLVPPLLTYFGTTVTELGFAEGGRLVERVGGVVLLLIPVPIVVYGAFTIHWQTAYERLSRTDQVLLVSALGAYALAIPIGVWAARAAGKRLRDREPTKTTASGLA